MASVFRALDPQLDRDVAVKVLPSFQAEDPTFIDRFKQEAQSVARLNHPNICTMCEYHFHSRKLSEVTILVVDSKDLASLVRDRGPEKGSAYVSEFLGMCSDIATNHDGMAARHGAYGVRAFFNAPIRNIDHVDQAIADATEIQLAAHRMGTEETEGKGLRVGITLDTGLAYAGTLGSNDARDFTVLGDLVEIAGHLQEHVESGGILVTEQVYQVIGAAYPNAQKRVLRFRGVREPAVSYWLG
jgi:class 3 adenylate cyclase